MTEFQLFQALRPFYPAREYALLPQVANGTGAGSFRHCDALALSLWPSRGLHFSGFEMKSYRGDWLREIKQPEKAEEIAQYCNHWWIVAAGPFVKADELPQPWGLMVWDEKKSALVKVKVAPFREAVKPDLPFLAAALRKAQETVTPEGALDTAHREGYAKGLKEGEERSKYELECYAKLKSKINEFEKACGLKIASGWTHPREVGEAVKQVLAGTIQHERESLRKTAERILQELSAEVIA